MKFKKAAAAVAVALALGGGMAGQAHANAFAGAIIDITGFTITKGTGTLDISDLQPGSLTFVDVLTNVATLIPITDTETAAAITLVGATNAPQACVALVGGVPTKDACVTGENNFNIVDPPPPAGPLIAFARSDSLLENQPISGTPFPVGVNAGTVAEVSLGAPLQIGSSSSNITLTSSFQFVLDQPAEEINIEFDARAFLQAWTGAGTIPPTAASATIAWSLTLSGPDGTIVEWAPGAAGGAGSGPAIGLTNVEEPCDLNQSTSVGPNNPADPAVDCSGSFSANVAGGLEANTVYSFVIEHGGNVAAVQLEAAAPEPSSLLLLGFGLAGIGFARRYWKAV